MSKTTAAIEETVQKLLAWKKDGSGMSAARVRREIDRSFGRIMTLIAPRIRHFIKQYGLVAHWEDAEQVCAIALHRAIESYDPTKAQFTTFINWMIRGELQGLRFRLMTDQRPSARKVAATTVSLNALTQASEEDGSAPEFLIEDEDALFRTEAGASAYLANAAMNTLLDSYVAHLRQVGMAQLSRRTRVVRKRATPVEDGRPRLKVNALDPEEVQQLDERIHRNHALVAQRLFELQGEAESLREEDESITKERMRQITKRAAKTIAAIAARDPRFAIMADWTALESQTAQPAPAVSNPPAQPTREKKVPEPVIQQDPTGWLCGDAAGQTVH